MKAKLSISSCLIIAVRSASQFTRLCFAQIFDGNSDQNTQVTNLFPRPIVARHVRCYPVTWKDRPAMRLEYIGCRACECVWRCW